MIAETREMGKNVTEENTQRVRFDNGWPRTSNYRRVVSVVFTRYRIFANEKLLTARLGWRYWSVD